MFEFANDGLNFAKASRIFFLCFSSSLSPVVVVVPPAGVGGAGRVCGTLVVAGRTTFLVGSAGRGADVVVVTVRTSFLAGGSGVVVVSTSFL